MARWSRSALIYTFPQHTKITAEICHSAPLVVHSLCLCVRMGFFLSRRNSELTIRNLLRCWKMCNLVSFQMSHNVQIVQSIKMIINKFVKKKKQQQHGKNCDVEWANMSTDKNIEHKPVSTGKKDWNSIRWISGDKNDSREGNMTLNRIKKAATATATAALVE